jgi:hypothetical protein
LHFVNLFMCCISDPYSFPGACTAYRRLHHAKLFLCLFQIWPHYSAPALHIDARILLIYFCVIFQIQPNLIVLAPHTGTNPRLSIIYSYVLFQIQSALPVLALHIDARILYIFPMSYFQIQTVLVVLALHIGARILFIYCVVFQIQLGFGILALHIDAHISLIYSCVIPQTFSDPACFSRTGTAYRRISMLYFRFSMTSWSLVVLALHISACISQILFCVISDSAWLHCSCTAYVLLTYWILWHLYWPFGYAGRQSWAENFLFLLNSLKHCINHTMSSSLPYLTTSKDPILGTTKLQLEALAFIFVQVLF